MNAGILVWKCRACGAVFAKVRTDDGHRYLKERMLGHAQVYAMHECSPKIIGLADIAGCQFDKEPDAS